MKPFYFEHKHQFDEKTYVELNTLFKRDSRDLRYAICLLIAVLMFYSKYTVALGIALLMLCSLRLFSPKLFKVGAHATFNEMKFIKEELTYGVSEHQLWIYGPHLKVNLDWEYAKVWDERSGWLRISSDHCPTFWFKTSDLKNKEIYQNVVDLCERYAVKFK
jgi:hypothetical protein